MIAAPDTTPGLGAQVEPGGGVRFRVWAPRPAQIALALPHLGTRRVLRRDAFGYADAVVAEAQPGDLYHFELNGQPRPDPASRHQPGGVHGPSQVMALAPLAVRTPKWRGPALEQYVFYELHIGAFTPEGTFAAAAADLPRLCELGITAVEIMPVAQFPGARNWGYDGAQPFAVQASYGGPFGLTAFVDACHAHGLAVVLDVVYNHLGPEGNYLAEFAPYFTDRYHTPWGAAINYDGPDSDPVRAFFIQNARYWLRDVGVDALRLDAIHGIYDASAQPFLAELQTAVGAEAAASGRNLYLIAESDLNDVRVLRPSAAGGFGMAAQWNDDFHHALHVLLTGERQGYYADFGRVADLAAALSHNFVFHGQYSSYRRRRHGNSAAAFAPRRFVAFAQNHDQIGNRAAGDRLATLVDFERQKLAAAVLLLSPFLPLLFMGEEYGETAPFPYFVDHGDPALIEAVRQGRAAEFRGFGWQEIPDPAAAATFASARLERALRQQPRHASLERLYQRLLALRGGQGERPEVWFEESSRVLMLSTHQRLALFHFASDPDAVRPPVPEGNWSVAVDSAAREWCGAGSALPPKLAQSSPALSFQGWQFAVYQRHAS